METTRTSYNFDLSVERRDSDSVKWDRNVIGTFGGNPEAVPFWVADMDFPPPPEVIEALHQRIMHPVFGYSTGPCSFMETFCHWTEKRYGWSFPLENAFFVPGMLTGIAAAVQVLTDRGDGVILQTPAYKPFFSIIEMNGRSIIRNPLLRDHGSAYARFIIDFRDLEEKMAAPRNRLLLLCSPHNPAGRVWSENELARIVALAEKHDVRIISDEIHADLTYPQFRHTPLSSMSSAIETITFMAPSKTFNIAGEKCAFGVSPSQELKRKIDDCLGGMALTHPSLFAPIAAMAAYQHGGPWLDALIRYLEHNLGTMEQFLSAEIPEVTLIRPEASFIAFIDCSALLPLPDTQNIARFFSKQADTLLHDGLWFGREGAGYVRINFGTQNNRLITALSRMAAAVRSL